MGFVLTRDAIIPAAAVAGALAWYALRRRRWRDIILGAVEYHRHHLNLIRREGGIGEESRELAHSMLMVVERQFVPLLRGAPGLLGILRGFLGEKSALGSLNSIVEKIYRDRMFTGVSDIDGRLERLFATMTSMIFRYHLLTSVIAPAAVLWMDFLLLLAVAGIDRRGPSRMYRDIARGDGR